MAVVTARRTVRRDRWLLAALLALAVVPRLPTLAQPLLEHHQFRQTWTAWTAQLFHERGIDLFHPLVPIFGPPYVLPSEFPLFQALGALVMLLGVPTDPAMRVSGLLTFVACAVALWLLVRDVADRATAFVAVGVFVATPLALLWSRTSMIEYLALGAGIAFLWAGLRWRDGRGVHWLAIALGFGLTSALVKPPTFVGCAIPLALARDLVEPRTLTGWIRARLDPRLIALGVVPIAASFAWLAYGDSLKAADPAASFLQSTGTLWRTYYYGALADRVYPPYVSRVGDELISLATGRFTLAFALVGLVAAFRVPRRSFWVALALSIAVPIAIFWGAYRQHDYYFIAVSAQTAMFAALGIVWAWRRMTTRPARTLMAILAVFAVVASLAYDSGYWTRIYDPSFDEAQIKPAARQIDAATRPGDQILMLGFGYDPSTLYYADRYGLMLTAENLSDALLRSIPHDEYRTLYVRDPWNDALWIGRTWRWVGAREEPVYRIADTAAGVADAYVVATDESSALASASSAHVLASAPITVPCDFNGADVPAGRQGTLLQLRAGYPFTARLSVGYVAGPVPARGAVWLDGSFTQNVSTVRVTCSGAPQLVVERVYDAGLDRR